MLARTSLSLPLLNFVRDSLPLANTVLWCILLPCMTSVHLLIPLLCYLELATNHHLSLLAKRDHFILNTDGTWAEFICLESKLSKYNTCNVVGKRAVILSIVGHEKKSELNISSMSENKQYSNHPGFLLAFLLICLWPL